MSQKTKNNNRTYILDFIKSNSIFIIPQYQRNYNWREIHCKRLLRDIKNASRKDNEYPKHFLGTIIQQQDEKIGGDPDKLFIVDGQQRITTIFLLLRRIQRIDGNLVDDTYFYLNKKEKLKLKKSDDEDFKKILQNSIGKTQSNLIRSFEYLKKEIELEDIDLAKKIMSGLEHFWVTKIDLKSKKGWDDVHSVFESINNTGLGLDVYDLVRNYLHLKQDPSQRNDLFSEYWHPLEEKFKKKNEEKKLKVFILNFITLKTGKHQPNQKNKAFNEFKRLFENQIKSGKSEKGYFLEFIEYGNTYYNLFINTDEVNDKGIKKRLIELRDMGKNVTSHHPFLLGIYHQFGFNNIDKEYEKNLIEEFIEIMEIINSYYIRIKMSTDIKVGDILPKFYARLCTKIKKEGREEIKLSHQLRKDIQDNPDIPDFPIDEDFKKGFLNKNMKNQDHLTKYILKSIASKTKEFDIKNTITLEHIMPQSLIPEKNNNEKEVKDENEQKSLKEWKDSFKKGNWLEIAKDNVYKIGNLTLLTGKRNSSASNAFFKTKKETYKDSDLPINQYFKEIESWNEGAIETRSKHLYDTAKKIWKPFFSLVNNMYKIEDIGNDLKIVDNKKIIGYNFYIYNNNREEEKGLERPCKYWSELFKNIIKELYEIKDRQKLILNLKYVKYKDDKTKSFCSLDDNYTIKFSSHTKESLIKHLVQLKEEFNIGLEIKLVNTD